MLGTVPIVLLIIALLLIDFPRHEPRHARIPLIKPHCHSTKAVWRLWKVEIFRMKCILVLIPEIPLFGIRASQFNFWNVKRTELSFPLYYHKIIWNYVLKYPLQSSLMYIQNPWEFYYLQISTTNVLFSI